MIIFDIGFDNSNPVEKIIGVIFFASLVLTHLGCLGYLHYFKVFDRTIEITGDGIKFNAINRTAFMKWHEVKDVYINTDRYYFKFNRVVSFVGRGHKRWKFAKINDKFICSEFTDEMLDEIKKYWIGGIGLEEEYNKYKKARDEKQRRKIKKKDNA